MQTDGKVTRTAVHLLDAGERTDEIARMLGGVEVSDQARAHAREMLTRATSKAAAPTSKAPAPIPIAAKSSAPLPAKAPVLSASKVAPQLSTKDAATNASKASGIAKKKSSKRS